MTAAQRTRRIILSARRRTLAAARPSWMSGAARLVDLGGVFNRYALLVSPAQSEAEAIGRDWARAGSDLNSVMQRNEVPGKNR